ncbi:MAG: hypothetical protein JST39_11645 [Bacteroidetes bacterium]|nr:hypothetical protein [Bacteroidota bacterium]
MFTKTDIEKYFLAQKQEGMLFIVLGIVALLLAILFFFLLRSPFYKGAALPLLIVGIVQLGSGVMQFRISDDDRVRNVYAFDMNPFQLKNEELPNRKEFLHAFVIFRWVWVIALLVGIGLLFYFKAQPGKQFWFGLGLTLVIEAAIWLGAAYVSEKRTKAYVDGLETWLEKTAGKS